MREVGLKRSAAPVAETILGTGQAALEPFLADDVTGFLEFARMDAQIAVGGGKNLLELRKRETLIHGQRTDHAQTQTFVDDAVERPRRGSGRYCQRTPAFRS